MGIIWVMLLSYYDNEKSGPAIIFIHGTASSNALWEQQYKLLNRTNFRVIGLDLRGHGNSSNPGGICTIDEHLKDLKETVEYLKIKGSIIFVGHSFGAVLSIKFAEKYPKLTRKLMLVSLPPKVPRLACLYYKWFLGKPAKYLKKKFQWTSKFPILKHI